MFTVALVFWKLNWVIYEKEEIKEDFMEKIPFLVSDAIMIFL